MRIVAVKGAPRAARVENRRFAPRVRPVHAFVKAECDEAAHAAG
jgi:hypothetical protein